MFLCAADQIGAQALAGARRGLRGSYGLGEEDWTGGQSISFSPEFQARQAAIEQAAAEQNTSLSADEINAWANFARAFTIPTAQIIGMGRQGQLNFQTGQTPYGQVPSYPPIVIQQPSPVVQPREEPGSDNTIIIGIGVASAALLIAVYLKERNRAALAAAVKG